MININDPKACCGCTACASICPHNAIEMKPDPLGFLYPEVDVEKCIECGLCERVCSFNSNYDKSLLLDAPQCYGVRHKDIQEVSSSRSGAAFIAISDLFLNNGGVVYGAAFANHFRVVHKRATTKQERDEFKGSKYVQSDLTGIFRLVKSDLKSGRKVLFSGTACQTSGLKSFIGASLSDNLYLIDVVCHGVPSPFIWRDYLVSLENKYNKKIVKVDFRDKKRFGWVDHKETVIFDDNTSVSSSKYTTLFYQDIMLRMGCGCCPYANTKRPSDISIADFWGWEKTNKEANLDNKGISLVMCNTIKGVRLFELAKSDLKSFPAPLENCLQPNLMRPTPLSKKTELFKSEYELKGFEYVFNKYGEDGWRYKLKEKVKFLKHIHRKIFIKLCRL